MKTASRLILRIGIALALSLLCAHVGLSIASRITLRHAYAALRDAGRPMDAKTLIPPEVPIDDNAAPLYESAIALMESDELDGSLLLSAAYRISRDFLDSAPSSSADMENLLEIDVVNQALALAEQAAARPQCRFNVQYGMGLDLSLAHHHQLYMMTHLLAARAVYEARQGNAADALSTIRSALRATQALRTEPFILASVVRSQQLAITLRALQQILALAPPDDETAAALSALLPSPADIRDHFLLTLDGERLIFAENGLIKMGTMGPAPAGSCWSIRRMYALYRYAPVIRSDHAVYLREMERLAREATRPYLENPSPAMNLFYPDASGLPWYSFYAQIALSSVHPHRKTMAAAQAHLQVAQTGLALLRHKLAHGAYPATLSEIDPQFLTENPLDPFTGHPLVYRPEGDGFLLYSLGENLADDNGTPESPDNRNSRAFDVVWRASR